MVYFAEDNAVINGIVDANQRAIDKDRYGLRDEQMEVARNTRSEDVSGE